tara:strand:- start:1614 stop:2924 length:1311 start_codon:yes stop_codon:yes gene_type:complete
MQSYLTLGKKIFPLCRSLTGKGTLLTLKEIKKKLPELKIKKVRCRKKVFDWKVPAEWNVKDAYIMDKFSKKIIDFKKNNLHLLNYSIPVKKKLNRNEILKKIYSIKKLPNAIPYVTSYYKKNWGFCETFKKKQLIKKNYSKKDSFKVKINTYFNKNGYMNYGEYFVKGKTNKEILISTYICHPSMANNELSGPLVVTALANYFKKKKPYYGIRFIYIPETIGSIAYIQKNLHKMKRDIIGGYVLTCIGDNRSYSYLQTKYNNTISDQAAIEAFKKLKIKFKQYSFLHRGSDERQFNSPGIDLGIGSLMRSKYGTYPEYHTSLDNFKLVNLKGLTGGFKISKLSIENILKKKTLAKIKKKIKKNSPLISTLCEPQLSKRNLYHAINFNQQNLSRKYLDFLQYADGTNSLNEISKYISCTFKQTKDIKKILKKNNLLK